MRKRAAATTRSPDRPPPAVARAPDLRPLARALRRANAECAARAVHAMLGAVLAYPRARTRNAWRGKPDDGLAMAAYWLAASNGSVTLDYEGRLFLSLWRLRAGSVGLGSPAPEPTLHPDLRLAPT